MENKRSVKKTRPGGRDVNRRPRTKNAKSACSRKSKLRLLALRELEASSSLALPVFLALDNTRIAGKEPAFLQ